MTKATGSSHDDEQSGGSAPAPVKKKRNRPTVSCAECRRLKLKCDRRVPCSSCSKRGCAALCPNGVLAAGPGNRRARSIQLHEKIEAMGKRIAELEDALATVQAQLSVEKHPLLAEELLLIKTPLSTQNTLTTINDIAETVSGALGTLTLGERPHFFGPHAAVDYLVGEESADDSASALPNDILLLAGAFPLTNVQNARSEAYFRLLTWLPPSQQAWTLIEQYYAGAAWLFQLIPMEELRASIFTPAYSPSGAEVPLHDLAVLFIVVLATGALMELDSAPVPPTTYYHLARVALGLDSVIDHPTLQAIRAIHMMSTFAQMADLPNCTTVCYSLIGLAARLCHMLGLHRDDTQWNLPADEQYRRRHVFWEVASFDSWSCLAFGRPPSFSATHVDAKIADDRDRFMSPDGIWQASFYHWSHTFIQHVVFKLIEQAFGHALVPYATVLRLDKLVRDHPVLRVPEDADDPSLLLQRTASQALTQRLLLYLHRSYFAHALTSHPGDPLQSPFAQSVLVSFRAAAQIHTVVGGVSSMGHRFWLFWSHAASAGLIFASIAVRAPGSSLAPPALSELDKLCEMMEDVGARSTRVSGMMPKLRKLRERAHEAYDAFFSGNGGVLPERQDEMELRFMWGETRLVDRGQPPGSSGMNALPPTGPSGLGVVPPSNLGAAALPTVSTIPSTLPSIPPLDMLTSHRQADAAYSLPHLTAMHQGWNSEPGILPVNFDAAVPALENHDLAWQRFVNDMGFGGQDVHQQHQQHQQGFGMPR
ncbi:hypothetical protein AURDEDRAFT_188566 [Auricularia subglabra TFB-10046 SS5]|nr:hypothetical protein AURDEDRAFT_188566 [Auricularia subglabra TFB-10046 SS5]